VPATPLRWVGAVFVLVLLVFAVPSVGSRDATAAAAAGSSVTLPGASPAPRVPASAAPGSGAPVAASSIPRPAEAPDVHPDEQGVGGADDPNVSTLALLNDSLRSGLYEPLQSIGAFGGSMAFDPGLDSLFVLGPSNSNQWMAEEIDAGTGEVVTAYNVSTCGLNAFDAGAAFDPDNGLLYVPCYSHVLAMDPTNGTIVATIPLDGFSYGEDCQGVVPEPIALAVAAPLDEVYILVADCANVTSPQAAWGPLAVSFDIVDDQTNLVAQNLTLGPTGYPTESWGTSPLAYDAASGQVYAAWNQTIHSGETVVSIIDPLTDHVVANLSLDVTSAYSASLPLLYDLAKHGVITTGINPLDATPQMLLIDPTAASGAIRLWSWAPHVPNRGLPVLPVDLAVGPGSSGNVTVSAVGNYRTAFEQVFNIATGIMIDNITTADCGPMVAGPGNSSLFLLDSSNSRVVWIAGSPAAVVEAIPFGLSTTAAAVDPATGTVFFSQGSDCGYPVDLEYCGNDSVGALSTATDRRSTSWPVTPAAVAGMVFDPLNQDLYVLSECGAMAVEDVSCLPPHFAGSPALVASGEGAVTAYSAQGRWLAETEVNMEDYGFIPEGMVVDTATGDLWVLTRGAPGEALTVLDPTTLGVITNISVGTRSLSGSLVYDPLGNVVYVNSDCQVNVPPYSADCLWGFNGTTFALVDSQELPGSVAVTAETMAYDAANNTLLLADDELLLLTLNASTAALTGYFLAPALLGVSAVAYDPVNQVDYAVGLNLTEINGTTGAIISSTPTTPPLFGTYGQPGVVVDPTTGTAVVWYELTGTLMFVPGPGPTTYSVSFPETGLPSSTNWTVTVGGHPETGYGNLSFFLPNGTYPYTVSPVPGFGQSSLSSSGFVEVTGASVVETTAKFSTTTYPISFSELAGSVAWTWVVVLLPLGVPTPMGVLPPYDICVVATQGPKASCTLQLANGTYAFLFEDLGSGTVLVGAPPAGELTIDGQGASFAFRLEAGRTTTLTFRESGLPAGAWWCPELEGLEAVCSPNSTVVFRNLTAGDYTYRVVAPVIYRDFPAVPIGYTVMPATGAVSVPTSGATVRLSFAVRTYAVTLAEVGLRPGTRWSVHLEGTTELFSTTQRFLTIDLANGTYGYTVLPVADYSGAWSGTVTIAGFPIATDGRFVPVLYNVTFVESGLSSGSSWCVKVGTTTDCSTSSSVVFHEFNGTYLYKVGSVTGYLFDGGHPATARVVGGPTTVAVKFVARHHTVILYSPSNTLAAEAKRILRVGRGA